MSAETARLLLVPLTLEVIQARLEREHFSATVSTPAGPLAVTYPPEWPGDVLPLFSLWNAEVHEEALAWQITVIDRTSMETWRSAMA